MKIYTSHIIFTGVLAVAVFASSSFGILPSLSPNQPSAFATFPGENGKIAFMSHRDGNWEIYVMNADGTNPTRLTNNNVLDQDPDWSPDGSKIVFFSPRDNFDIFVMNADGSEQTRLTNDRLTDWYPSWSPDGEKIVFVKENDIYVMNADGSGQTRLTSDWRYGAPSWSPDGEKIAFFSSKDNFDIFVMNADGSEQTRLTNNPGGDLFPDWSPDGSKIAFVSTRAGNWEIYVMNADGSGQTRLTNTDNSHENYPSWSPDGSKIAFVRSSPNGIQEIYVMNADGSGQINISNNPALETYPDWGSTGAPPPADTTPPVLTVPDDMTVEATGPDGAEVPFEEDLSATDDVDGPVEVTCDYNSGDTFPIGETVVTCSAEDAAGNSAEETFTITVQDTTDPDVEITEVVDRRNRVLEEGDTTPTPYVRVTFEATDAVGVEDTECSLDGQGFTPCTSPVVYDRLSRGTHEVTVRATDDAENTGEDRFLFTVGSPPSNASPPGRQ